MEKVIDRFLNLLMAVSVAAFTAVMLAYIARYDLGFSREEIRTFAVIAAAVGGHRIFRQEVAQTQLIEAGSLGVRCG